VEGRPAHDRSRRQVLLDENLHAMMLASARSSVSAIASSLRIARPRTDLARQRHLKLQPDDDGPIVQIVIV
jgi:hypothetical protein